MTALDWVGLALIALYLVAFVAANAHLQWDFKQYLQAARAAWAGLDPYRIENLTLPGRPATFPFVYPPIVLPFFRALTALPNATTAWIVLKAALLAALVLLWRRWLPRGEHAPGRVHVPADAGWLALTLVAVFGWNGAALCDLRAGNVTLLECALLWSAFECYRAGRRTAFALLVVIASCFKLWPACFLLLLLAPAGRERPSPGRLILALALLAGLVFGPTWIRPASHWRSFLSIVPPASALGGANPSGLALARSLVERAGVIGPAATRIALAIWVASAIALLAISAPFLRGLWRAHDPQRWVMAAVMLETLLAPRPMAYGFLVLAPAPLFFAPAPFRGRIGGLLLAIVLSAQGLSSAAHIEPSSALVTFSPLLLTLAVWLLVVHAGTRAALPVATAATRTMAAPQGEAP
jgi:hypothetical protein